MACTVAAPSSWTTPQWRSTGKLSDVFPPRAILTSSEELTADRDAFLGRRRSLGPDSGRQGHRTYKALSASRVVLVGPALDQPRIERVVAPPLRERVEDRNIVAQGFAPPHAFSELIQLFHARTIPALRGKHTGIPKLDCERNGRAGVVDVRHRPEPLQQWLGELEHQLREVAFGQADHGP